MQIIKKSLRKIYYIFFQKNPNVVLNEKWSNMEYILNSTDFNIAFLKQHTNVQELEHQVGRYLNMKEIIEKIDSSDPAYKIDGEIIILPNFRTDF